ncbi:MAG: energy-coupling factor ABC transporter ATP-binding protein [Chloroflexi bacterium]|nr:energy-coupling factor ABC transporter ATP-binding protein [Chloroflexota bacterium]MCL5952560.1 energy-coupling factor ABC transporter ATP-binding protein [Chloroflexota bacterium]
MAEIRTIPDIRIGERMEERAGHAGTAVFELEHASYAYTQQVALRDIDLTVRAGERIAILGANGSGKSTLLKILDALYFPTEGSIRAFGEPLTEEAMQDPDRAFWFRRHVGLVFQDPEVQLFSPTVWDEVTFAPLHLGLPRAEVIERSEWAMELLGIGKLRDRAPHRLSGGEKKKVALASVLSLRPDVWLLDEPTASLDPRSQSRLLDFIDELAHEGKTIITATHDLDIVEEIAERVIMFCEDHEITGEGTPGQVLSDTEQLVHCNLIHEHRHRHAATATEHVHPHLHKPPHEHEHKANEPNAGDK